MLDLRFVLDNLDAVRENCKNRRVTIDFDRLVTLARRRSEVMQELEAIRRQRNELQKGAKGRGADAAAAEAGRRLKDEEARQAALLKQVEADLAVIHPQIPNMTHRDAPVGGGEEQNRELRKWGTPRTFEFAPLDHVQLGERLRLIDFASGQKATGSKFYYLTNEAVFVELALIEYALRKLVNEGFQPAITPDLAKMDVLLATGFNPRGDESNIYCVEGTDLGLIATAEITLGGMYQETTLPEAELPLLMAGVEPFASGARQARTAARRRGWIACTSSARSRCSAFCAPEQSDDLLQRLVRIEEEIYQGLGLAYRVVECCTGDLGGAAYRKYDIEAWMPGRSEHGSYGEVTSASNCSDYQARRLGARCKGQKTRLMHTLNGTAVACSRAMVAILENNQQRDGSVVIPRCCSGTPGSR
ncbi:MAG: serine--tRNA ligase [Planctomycetota bacterium]